MTIPFVIESGQNGSQVFDIFARLLQDRVVCLHGEVDDESAGLVTAQLLYLHNQSEEQPIRFFINSPGGSVTAGMAIYDAMRLVTPPVHTICWGQAASMGALLLCSGEQGHRYALPNARVMIHQPLGGTIGRATDIQIHAREIIRIKESLNQIMAQNTGQPYEKVKEDTESDRFLSATEAKEYGLIDHIVQTWNELP